MTNAYLNIKMPGKVVIVDSFNDLPNVSDAVENTLYITRFNSDNEEETAMYEFVNGDYRSMVLSTFDETELEGINNQLNALNEGIEDLVDAFEQLEEDVEELKEHPLKLISTEEVHGLRYNDDKFYIRLEDDTVIEFKGGNSEEIDLITIQEMIEAAVENHENKTVFKDKIHGLSVDGGILEYWDHNKEEWVELFASEFQTYPRIKNLTLTSGPDGDYVEVSYENPVSPTYLRTEVYISEQDITSSDREDLASVSTLIIGDGETTTHQYEATRNKTYYVMAYAVHDVDGEIHYASPRSASVHALDTSPPDEVADISVTPGDGRLAVSWTNPTNDDFVKTRGVYKKDSVPANQNDGIVFTDGTEENKTITSLINGEIYYVRFFTYDFSENVNSSDDMIASGMPSDVQVPDTGPGPQELIAGDMDAGYFGTVTSNEMFTGSELSSAVGISAGTLQHNTTDWLKFAWQGKILFRPMKPIRHTISWDNINAAGCVFGTKIVKKNGLDFKVRLMKGALTDPSLFDAPDRGAKGSEWNRLMLPIHEQAANKSWAYPAYVEDDIPNWGIGFTDADLLTHNTHGNGSYQWCQETRNTNSANRVIRGGIGVSYSVSGTSTGANAGHGGWAPLLELVK